VQITPFLADLGNTSSLKGPFAEFWIFAAVYAFLVLFSNFQPGYVGSLNHMVQVCACHLLGQCSGS
jgi:hypothetical protein